ncbi:MAG: DegT/DnrJ/EryC1/StrS family aminotransferase [Solobacterium sp.]|nr:DegT/DnrJ/EryC1/StrS family aminotransferase [Solobacterium sp.]
MIIQSLLHRPFLTVNILGSTVIITSPFTFASTTHAIVRNGLVPVFADIKETDYTLDPSKIEALITDKTVAILPIHVYGHICDVEAIQQIASKHNLKVIYDSAHVFGVKYKNKGIANYGDANMFSFHATKVFHTIEGGAITCKHPQIIERLKDLKNFGIIDEEHVRDVGGNAKMNEFCAAMGICNLRHINEYIEKRELVTKRYDTHLSQIDGLQCLSPQKDVLPNYAYYPVLFNPSVYGHTRDEVYEELKKHHIYARKYFYPITSAFDCYKEDYDASLTPIALHVSKNILTLPLYAELELEAVDEICKIIKEL